MHEMDEKAAEEAEDANFKDTKMTDLAKKISSFQSK